MWHSYTDKEIKKLKKEAKKMIDELSNEEFVEFFCVDKELEKYIDDETNENKNI